MAQIDPNVLYYGDNLEVLRKYIPDESVDLVYLDPPFNSKRPYNVLFKESDVHESEAQIEAFVDTWHWNDHTAATFEDVARNGPEPVARLLASLVQALGHNDVTAYLTMMAPRLVELRRAMKPSASLWLHCDPTASHYLRVLADSVFGAGNFRSEVIWRRSTSHNKLSRRLGPVHDTILFYAKTPDMKIRKAVRPHYRKYVADAFKESDAKGPYRPNEITGSGLRGGESGRPWRGIDISALGRHWAIPGTLVEDLDTTGLSQHEKLDLLAESGDIVFSQNGFPRYLQRATSGVPYQDIWAYQPYTDGLLLDTNEAIDRDVKWLENEEERLGYPTQKPLGLLERILRVASDEGQVVLDPFCGCGTAMEAAQKLGRQWVGIDITHLAIGLIRRRLLDNYSSDLGGAVRVVGEPKDTQSALELARQDKYQFQWWAVDRLDAQPIAGEKKKGRDKGIDGVFGFVDGARRDRLRVIISVKGGATGVKDVRDLVGTLQRESKDTPLAILVTADTRTRDMIAEAAAAGVWTSTITSRQLPVVQVLTADDLINGRFELPGAGVRVSPFRRAKRSPSGSQATLPRG